MTSDRQLQHDVLAELKRAPRIDVKRISVTVRDGVVPLEGTRPDGW